MAADQNRVFRFGVFEATESSGELRKHGVRVKLHAQPFQILVMLLERPAEIVTRDEMRRRLWGDGTFVDFDNSLNTAINKVRDALDDSAAKPRYIETVAGKGYRFILPVQGTGAIRPAPVEAPTGGAMLNAPIDLPAVSRTAVKFLLVAIQGMYLSFYLGALANLAEIHEIFLEASLPPGPCMAVLVATAAISIPVRLYLMSAVLLDFTQLPEKFARMFPGMLALDLLWALSPFLLIHHISAGLALGLSAPLIYAPFAQRSLVLMYSRRG